MALSKAQQIVDAITAAMLENPNVKTVTIDGTVTTFNSTSEMIALLNFWESRLKSEKGRRPMIRRINLSGGFNG